MAAVSVEAGVARLHPHLQVEAAEGAAALLLAGVEVDAADAVRIRRFR